MTNGMQCEECGVWVVDVYNHATNHLKASAKKYAEKGWTTLQVPVEFSFVANPLILERDKKPKEWDK